MPTIHLRNDTIILYKRPESPNWQAEFRYSDGSVRKISTRTANEHEASAFAINAYSGQHALAKTPKPKVTFGLFCKRYSEALAAKPIQKAIYPTYRMFLEKWIEPFFRDHTSIDEDDLERFYAHHRKTLGRVPAKNTINARQQVTSQLLRM